MTTKPNDGGPAFPNEGFNGWGEPFEGMSLRDYFAAKAMHAFLVCPLPSKETAEKFKGFTVAEFISTRAYEMADEMLKARQV